MPIKKKYRINELLGNLSVSKNKLALEILPATLKVSVPTLHNYRNIKLGDNQDIPHEKVVILEKFFGLQPGELQNFTVDHIIPISQTDDTQLSFTAADFGLVKS